MHYRLIRACAVAIAVVVSSTVIALAADQTSSDPPVTDAPVSCHVSIDPGFVATIEDLSNDRGFFTTFEDISNDSGFLYPVPWEPPLSGDEPAPCLPIPPPDIEP